MNASGSQNVASKHKLRWYQFTVRTLLVLALLTALVAGWPEDWRLIQWHRFQAYVGKDLRKLDDAEQKRFRSILGSIIPETKDWPGCALSEPWFVWRVTNEKGSERFILLRVTGLWEIPGASSASIFVLNSAGKVVNQCEFSTGWRIDVVDAELTDHQGIPCVKVSTAPAIIGADIATQYYAMIDDTFALVRLEDSHGKPLVVNYHNPNHTVGAKPPQRTAQEWEAALRCNHPAEVLRTLIWLGGDHSDPPIRNPGNCWIEKYGDAALVYEARSRPGVRQGLADLTRSPDPWIKAAAKNAAASDISPR
jgi:hypothetical protein